MNQEEIIIITRVLSLLDFAEHLPRDIITQSGNKQHQPSTVGEYIVTYAIHPLLTQDWSNSIAEKITDDLLFYLSSLDIDVSDSMVWDDLFIAKNRAKIGLDKSIKIDTPW